MFIKSKHEWNDPVNKYSLFMLPKKMSDKTVVFPVINFGPINWIYETKEERDLEFEWVISQIEVAVNE